MILPSAPALGLLSIASPDDILRLGIVAIAGFRYAEQLVWERPCHAQYPHDTLNFFPVEIAEFIRSREHIVLVAKDRHEADENSKTEAVIPEDNGWEPPAAGEEVVVGLAVWKLQPGSKRVGHFQNNEGTYPDVPESKHGDENKERAAKIIPIAEEAQKKYLGGLSTIERTVVHPAYWRRAHGTNLTNWGLRLADVDHVNQGVLASTMGAVLFKHAGFSYLETYHVEGDKDDDKGFSFEVLEYFAK